MDCREEARAQLPYLASDAFTHQRADDWYVFTYVRRPAYYTAVNVGERGTGQQRMGLGLVWHPEAGAVIQSQSGRGLEAWGTRAVDADGVYEAGDIRAEVTRFELGGEVIEPEEGVRDLPNGEADFQISYPLGDEETPNRKTLSFTDAEFTVEVSHRGAFQEQIPLLVRQGGEIAMDDQIVRLERGGVTMLIEFDGAGEIDVVDGDGVEVLVATGTGKLSYTIRWESE